jgi:two-component system sensor histidine kinase VicK
MAGDNGNSLQEIKQIGKLSNDGVFIFGVSENQFLFVNAPFVKILEINKKLLMNDSGVILDSIEDIDRDYLQSRFSELMLKGSVEDVQIRIPRKGSRKDLSFSAYLSSDKSYVIGFLRDISKPREHEEYLINFGARKDAILDSVSQNLSTPLNLSKFTVDLIEKAVKEKKYDKLYGHIKLMREVTSESIRIIDDFLQEEHLESPKVGPKANRFDVISKILIVLDKLKEANPDKRFNLKSKARHLFIRADELKFFQIVHNLLSNSIKFTASNGVIETVVEELKDHIRISVIDDGVGIPEKLKPFIFERRSRAGRPGLNGEISNGIGLYVVWELTEILGGRISFKSSEGKGSTFVLELPKG